MDEVDRSLEGDGARGGEREKMGLVGWNAAVASGNSTLTCC